MTYFETMEAKGYALRIRVAGHSDPVLWFTAGPESCGPIRDGVGLEHGDGTRGGWTIAYDDLKAMYDLATEVRKDAVLMAKWEGREYDRS